jgi:hypothetical protein
MEQLDYFLDRITMYRLVFYVLLGLIIIASFFGMFGWVQFSSFSIIFTLGFITILCWTTNTLFARVFKAQTNVESVYITAFILTLIVSPVQKLSDFFPVGWIAVLSMTSKYVLAVKGKHIFNPAAIAVVLTSFGYGLSASWWIGTSRMLPFVLIGGLMVIRKLRFERLFFAYLITNIVFTMFFAFMRGTSFAVLVNQMILNSPLLFFATIMLTEPSTLPPTKSLRTFYGGLIGFLTVPQVNIFGFYFTPELALTVGNTFSFMVSSKQKLLLTLAERIQIAPDIFDFIFIPKIKPAFAPGQYMEWTLEHDSPDSRGNRRYLTIASSPTENSLRLGIKFYPNGSSFKKSLFRMGPDSKVTGAQLAGDFTLPKNPKQKLVFMAGGIGITPFRSIVKYLIDKNERRDVVLFYSNKIKEEIVYKDVFDKAREAIGLRVVDII